MRVLLVQSFFSVQVDNPSLNLQEPLGLLSIATYIKNKLGDLVEIRVLDLYELGKGRLNRKGDQFIVGLNDERIICEQIENFNPDIIGITANFSAYFQDVITLGKIISTNFRNIKLVLGGAHVTMDAENILQKNPFIDYIVRREGEVTFLELLQTCMKRQNNDFSNIKGLTYREGERIVSNEDRPLINDINILPMLDRKFINMDFYKRVNCKTLAFARKTAVSIIFTSRGCPFNCIFCSTKNMWERKFRAFTPERVVAEIKHLYYTYGIREIAIWDDQFLADKKRVELICDKIIELNLDISFSMPSGTSPWLVDEGLLRKMKKAGFYRLCFPIESGNENTIKFIRKPVNLTKMGDLIKAASKLGFWTSANFIIGFPYETREEIMTTIKYAYECGVDYPIFFIAQPLKGAELYDVVVKEGLLKAEYDTDITTSKFDTKYLSVEEINELLQKARNGIIKTKIKFYLKPANFYYYLFPKFRTYSDIKFFITLFYAFFVKPKFVK